MVPLYAARLPDLGPDDLVVVECACGHLEHVSAAMLAPPVYRFTRRCGDLKRRLNAGSTGRKDGVRWA